MEEAYCPSCSPGLSVVFSTEKYHIGWQARWSTTQQIKFFKIWSWDSCSILWLKILSANLCATEARS